MGNGCFCKMLTFYPQSRPQLQLFDPFLGMENNYLNLLLSENLNDGQFLVCDQEKEWLILQTSHSGVLTK